MDCILTSRALLSSVCALPVFVVLDGTRQRNLDRSLEAIVERLAPSFFDLPRLSIAPGGSGPWRLPDLHAHPRRGLTFRGLAREHHAQVLR